MRFVLLTALALLTACVEPAPISTDPITYGAQSGQAPDDAVIIVGAKDKGALEQAKRNWLAQHYPGWVMGESTMNSLAGQGDDGPTYYHAVAIRKGAAQKTVYFDVNHFVFSTMPSL
jgi:hypothetical protein